MSVLLSLRERNSGLSKGACFHAVAGKQVFKMGHMLTPRRREHGTLRRSSARTNAAALRGLAVKIPRARAFEMRPNCRPCRGPQPAGRTGRLRIARRAKRI